MMAGNPSWWSMYPPSSQQSSPLLTTSQAPPNSLLSSSQYVLSGSSPHQLPLDSLADIHHNQEVLPQSWSQLLSGGLPAGEEDRFFPTHHFQPKKLANWEEQQGLITNHQSSRIPFVDVKQEAPQNNNVFGHANINGGDQEFQKPNPATAAWSQQIIGVSSPRSCVTSLSSNILDFSYTEADTTNNTNIQHPDHSSSECNSTAATGGACKKARVQPSTSQPPLKVRKEKLGDRITALHQLVSPFGKTDTASVLLEAIGYIRFLQGQIEALSSPYLGTSSPNMRNNQQFVQGDMNCVFPEDPGQLLNDNCLKRKGGPPNQDNIQDKPKDLSSRGLCLVPVSCTQQVGSDNGADYWAPAALGGGF